MLVIFGVLYYAAPNARVSGVRWVTGGALLALVAWIVASLLFALYVSNFSSYNKTYGTLGGVVVFLLWMWLTNMAILLGAEFNAETERARQLETGVRAPSARSSCPSAIPRRASSDRPRSDPPQAPCTSPDS